MKSQVFPRTILLGSDVRLETCRPLGFGASLLFHLLVVAVVPWLGAGTLPRRAATTEAAHEVAVFVVPAAEDSTLPGLNPIDTTRDESMIRAGQESSTLSLPDFKFDFRKIADRATLLFPFLTPGLSLEHFALTAQRETSDGFRNPFAPPPAGEAGGPKPPLMLSDAALQALIDESWSRRDRWSVFQSMIKLADTYSSDAGKLPGVFHDYVEQNGLQPYVDAKIRDPRLWAELGLTADHVNFVGFISGYVSEHPSSKATTELLFLLDELTQASLDALVTLLDIDPNEDLRWTHDHNADAYDLMVEIRRYYNVQLERKGLASAGALRGHYDRVRLAILTSILRTTPQGYRASDARFLVGAILWREGKNAEALQSWRGVSIDPTDRYVTAYSEIVRAIRDAAESLNNPNPDAKQINRVLDTQINRALDGEHGRWIVFSIDRLHHFGYHFDTFSETERGRVRFSAALGASLDRVVLIH